MQPWVSRRFLRYWRDPCQRDQLCEERTWDRWESNRGSGIPSASGSSGANHSLSAENLTGYLLGGFRYVAQALGMEAAFNQTQSTSKWARHCLCIFDIDRTITGRQGDTRSCPGNSVVGGHDSAYGGGKVTLSHLGQNVWNTWCSECHVRSISAHHDARPNIPVPQNILNCNRGCKAQGAERLRRELNIRASEVYFFDDKARLQSTSRILFSFVHALKICENYFLYIPIISYPIISYPIICQCHCFGVFCHLRPALVLEYLQMLYDVALKPRPWVL